MLIQPRIELNPLGNAKLLNFLNCGMQSLDLRCFNFLTLKSLLFMCVQKDRSFLLCLFLLLLTWNQTVNLDGFFCVFLFLFLHSIFAFPNAQIC